jgi:hypothetical protein
MSDPFDGMRANPWRDRSARIFTELRSGSSYKDVASKYGVTVARIRQVYAEEAKRRAFEFTWEDVDLLRLIAEERAGPFMRPTVTDLADRIEALLPPREEG